MGLITTIKSLFGIRSNGDRTLVCDDCNKKFVFDLGEQTFFKEKGFSDPKRCPKCRKRVKSKLVKRSRNGRGRHRRRRRSNSIIDGVSPYADE